MFGQGIPIGFAGGAATFPVRFLGIAGGNSGIKMNSSPYGGGGGGAGEYLELTNLAIALGSSYQVIIGAGGGGDTTFRTNGNNGNPFDYELSGSSGNGGRSWPGGYPASWAGYPPTLNEAAAGSIGNSGGSGYWLPAIDLDGGMSGGGGGAGGNGGNASGPQRRPGNGGGGLASDITGTSVTRAGGGGGAIDALDVNIGYQSSGGSGIGGKGGVQEWQDSSVVANATNGAINTGSGGGSGTNYSGNGTGGSGIVILRYPNTLTITVGPGLTSTTTTTGTDKVTTFTAGSDNISFA